jgi:signal transduction histidine kinase
MERLLRLDLAKITQVFSNILSNAIKFTAAGGSIDIDSDLTREGGLVIWIRDTGQGVAPEDLERVLQPFGQLEDHLTRQNSGIGLGLPVARALVRLHGGDLTLTSEPGVGTTVEIRLPPDRMRPLPAAAA